MRRAYNGSRQALNAGLYVQEFRSAQTNYRANQARVKTKELSSEPRTLQAIYSAGICADVGGRMRAKRGKWDYRTDRNSRRAKEAGDNGGRQAEDRAGNEVAGERVFSDDAEGRGSASEAEHG